MSSLVHRLILRTSTGYIRNIIHFSLGALAFGCSPAGPYKSTEDLRLGMEKGTVLLIDVRDFEDFQAAHIPGAKHFTEAEIGQRFDEFPRNIDIVLYCKKGGRSGRAAQFLKKKGFNRAYNFGSFSDWAGEAETGAP